MQAHYLYQPEYIQGMISKEEAQTFLAQAERFTVEWKAQAELFKRHFFPNWML
jgi:hypothetical protein